MAARVLRLNYRSIDQFVRHYERLIQGKIFLKSTSPLAEKTPLVLQIDVPGIEQSVPLESLLPTSRFIFEELKSLKEMEAADPDNPSVKRRFRVVKRILKWVARRLVLEDVGGAQHFLEQLYENGLLKFEELPSDVQYLVNTTKMANDIRAHSDRYAGRLVQSDPPGIRRPDRKTGGKTRAGRRNRSTGD